MNIFTIVLVLIFLLFIFFYQTSDKNKKILYCFIIAVILFAISIFRNIETGLNDTQFVYLPEFVNIQKKSIFYILTNYKDPIFYVCSKFFTFFSTNARLWLALINIPLIYAITKLIYKESKNYMLSFIMFVSLGFYTLCSFTLLRHSIALAFTTLAFYQIKEKNLKKFLLYVIIASLFHQTAIIFIFAYWISSMKICDRKYFLSVIAFVLSIILKEILTAIILYISRDGRYSFFYTHQTALSYTYFLMNLLIMIVSDITSSPEYKKTEEYLLLSRLVTIGCCLTAFMPVLGEFNRLSMFYLIYEIILLPNCILSNENKKNNVVIIIGCAFFFSLYLSNFGLSNAGLLNYNFFWN